MQRHRSDVSGVILKGTLASSQHRNRTFKPLQKFRKSRNFALCLIDDFVFSKLFYTLFFVAILLIFNQFYKVTKYSAEKATEGLVQYWEPAKWTAKLRELKTDNKLLLFKTDMSSGHGGASGRFESLKDDAFEYAFLLKLENKTEVELQKN